MVQFHISITDQCMYFFWSVLLGIVFGVLYELFRLIRITFCPNKIITAIIDIIYFMICAVLFFLYTLEYGQGMMRLFELIGAAIGLILYLITAGQAVSRILRIVITTIKRVLFFLFKWILKPFIFIGKKFYKLFGKIYAKIQKNIKNMIKNLKTPLKENTEMLYNDDVQDVKGSDKRGRKSKSKEKKQTGI